MKTKILSLLAVGAIASIGLLPVTANAMPTAGGNVDHKAHKGPASANGKYATLIQKIHCPSDKKKYGTYRDYGYWGGGAWCGQTGQAGYWVWVSPTWYVWQTKN